MKRLVLQCFMIFLLIMPSTGGTSISPTEQVIEAQSGPEIYTRVYGEDYSRDIYHEVSLHNYENIVQKFTENGSRRVLDYSRATSGPNMHARNYIIQQFEELSNGRIETEIIGNYLNVVGKLPGYLPGNNPAFAITAHYDSAEGSPGANCDGSGIAAVLELVRVLSMYDWPLDIYFITFNGLFTMLPMEGSPEVVHEFRNRSIDFLMLYNVDTLLVQAPDVPVDERIQFGYAPGLYHWGRYWAELARQMSKNIGLNRIVPVPSSSFYLWTSSDHYAFYQQGFTNVMCAFESGIGYDTAYQNEYDRWENGAYIYYLGQETAAVIGASIAFTMSRALDKPVFNEYDFTLGSDNWKEFYITVSTPTIVNVSSRWFGGSASFYLLNPQGSIIATREFSSASAWEYSQLFNQYVSQNGQYTLVVHNNDFRSIGLEIDVTIESDIDGNGILDRNEYWIDEALFDSDQDSDGLSDAEELFLGTDMMNSDSDRDTLPDKYEVDNGFDPRDPSDANEDADSDGLSNAQEYSAGLNPHSADSDNDLMPDLWELENGLNPLNNDADLDFDNDGITNLEEYLNDTDPQVPEPMEIRTEWFATPLVVIALIGVFLYIRRREDPWN